MREEVGRAIGLSARKVQVREPSVPTLHVCLRPCGFATDLVSGAIEELIHVELAYLIHSL